MSAILSKHCLDVGLVCTDPEAALRFYRDLLGFPEEGEMKFPNFGTVKRLRCGESVLRLFVPDLPPRDRASTAGFAAQTGLRYLTLTVSNLHAVVADAQAAHYPVPTPPREIRPGVWAAQLEDGQGTTVELMQTGA
jgi:catechol 2,3-dioxygenase-like lactoylglutathione lyase family enzyme